MAYMAYGEDFGLIFLESDTDRKNLYNALDDALAKDYVESDAGRATKAYVIKTDSAKKFEAIQKVKKMDNLTLAEQINKHKKFRDVRDAFCNFRTVDLIPIVR